MTVAEPKFLDMEMRTSPHFSRGVSVECIMHNVVLALLPVAGMAVYAFGISALSVILAAIVSCLAAEAAVNRVSGRECSLVDGSALITGILLGLTLPPGFPLWMAALGGAVSILVGKAIFGGLGFNLFNPALVGRAFLQASFPVSITTWSPAFAAERFTKPFSATFTFPFARPEVTDALSGATPLAAMKFDGRAAAVTDLAFGATAGSVGETCAVIILLCGAYLALRKMLDWRIPAGILGTVALSSAVLHLLHPEYPGAGFMLFSGGLMLGAVFMATDMVTSPMTPKGVWLYSALIGIIVVAIRVWGGLPEGVMYAILLGNAAAPGLDRVTQPRVYGTRKKPAGVPK